MTEPIIEQILREMESQGATITTTNGYQYSIASVLRSIVNLDTGDIPALVIIPGTEETERMHGKVHISRIVAVEAKAEIGTENPSTIQERLLADVVECFTRPDQQGGTFGWARLAEDVNYTGGGPQGPPSEDQEYTGIIANFTIRYKVLKGDPYQQ